MGTEHDAVAPKYSSESPNAFYLCCVQYVQIIFFKQIWERGYFKNIRSLVTSPKSPWPTVFEASERLSCTHFPQYKYFVSWQDFQWKLHSSWAEGGAAPQPGRAVLPHAAGEPLASALPGLHAAQVPAPAVVSGPQPSEAAPEVWWRPSHPAVMITASLPG